MMSREEILDHVKARYGVEADYPWARTPDYAILRHDKNRKWFGAIIDITEDKLGLNGDRLVDVLNLKCDPLMVGSLVDGVSIFPGYHMNREHWVSVLLDSPITREQICDLIDLSYQLTR